MQLLHDTWYEVPRPMERMGNVIRLAWIGVLLIAVLGCGEGGGGREDRAIPAATPGIVQMAVVPSTARRIGGCGGTAIYQGPVSAPITMPSVYPYAVSRPPDVVAVLFAYPLQAVHPKRNNKILWSVGASRNGSPLAIEGRPLGGSTTILLDREPANASVMPPSSGELSLGRSVPQSSMCRMQGVGS